MEFDDCIKYLGRFIEFFSDEEKWLAFRIFSYVSDHMNQTQQIVDEEETDDEDEDERFSEAIEATKKNFDKIVKLFQECAKSRKAFRKKFPKWSGRRQINTKELRQLASDINKDRFNCNVSTNVGGVVGIIGGGVIVSSLIFPPAAVILAAVGAAVAGLGGATVVGTSITETSLLGKCLNEAQSIKDKDVEEFKLVCSWFKHSQEIIDLLGEIMGFDLAKYVLNSLKDVHADLSKLGKFKKDTGLDSKLTTIIKLCVDKLMAAGIYKSALEFTFLIPTVVTFFFVIVLLKKHNNLVFSSVVAAHQIVFGLVRTLDITADVGVMISRVALKAVGGAATEVSKATARIVATGVFAGLGIALDVANVVIASIDIHNGSISPHATQLETLAKELDKEHTVIKSVYDALTD